MSTYFIEMGDYFMESDCESLLYYEDEGIWRYENGEELGSSEINNIGRDVLDEFANGYELNAYIKSDYLDMAFELNRM